MWSGDSTTTEDELVEAITASAIDVLCITDHHAIDGARRLRDALPCRVVVGEEIRSTQGEIIGLFLDERIPFGLTPHDTAARIREQGGVVYIPHPFDPMRRNLVEPALEQLVADGLVDALEVRNAKTSLDSLNRRAQSFADAHDARRRRGQRRPRPRSHRRGVRRDARLRRPRIVPRLACEPAPSSATTATHPASGAPASSPPPPPTEHSVLPANSGETVP